MFISELKKIPFDQIKLLTNDPNEMWFLWKTIFLDVLNKHTPATEIKIKENSLSCITSDIRRLIRQRDYLKKKANKTTSKYLWQAYQHLRNKVKYSIRTARTNYYSSRFEEHQRDIKNTWKILKEIIKIITDPCKIFRNNSGQLTDLERAR